MKKEELFHIALVYWRKFSKQVARRMQDCPYNYTDISIKRSHPSNEGHIDITGILTVNTSGDVTISYDGYEFRQDKFLADGKSYKYEDTDKRTAFMFIHIMLYISEHQNEILSNMSAYLNKIERLKVAAHNYQIRCAENGDVIAEFEDLIDAKNELKCFEDQDREDDNYTDGFYEIYDPIKEEVL